MKELETKLVHMEKQRSPFENFVRVLSVPVLKDFKKGANLQAANFVKTSQVLKSRNAELIEKHFPLSTEKSENRVLKADKFSNVTGKKVAILFSGGPAPGGHNVIVGVRKALGPQNLLLATKSGPKGLLKGDFFEITMNMVDQIYNTGGFDFMGSDRTKIKTEEQFNQVKSVVVDHAIDAIIIVGGDDSNTNAAVLAEFLRPIGITVVGVPKTIDGDLQLGDLLPISFGFDTATKIYAEMVGNILQDTASSLKYWHFVKIMGRAASHVALEVALQTKPAYTIISEEVLEKKLSLDMIVNEIAELVKERSERGINHGLVLIPEGLIEFVPEMKLLLSEMDQLIGAKIEQFSAMNIAERKSFILEQLSDKMQALYKDIPVNIQDMLLLERDSHGNLPLSQIPTEDLIVEMVSRKVCSLKESCAVDSLFGQYKFLALRHFFGYEGRCGAPTLFDAAYCLNLGLTAGSLVLGEHTGYMASLSNLHNGGLALAIPLTGLLNVEARHGHEEFVIEKALVRLGSPAFKFFAERRKAWGLSDLFTSPGPRQLSGPISKQLPISVALNRGYQDLSFNFG